MVSQTKSEGSGDKQQELYFFGAQAVGCVLSYSEQLMNMRTELHSGD